MSEAYEATIADRARAFRAALDGAGRVAVYRPNALGNWDVETFSPEAVKHVDGEYIGHLQQRVEELEAALRYLDGQLYDHGFAVDGPMRSTIRAALTPPEQ